MGARLGWLAACAKGLVQLVLENTQNCPASAGEVLNLEHVLQTVACAANFELLCRCWILSKNLEQSIEVSYSGQVHPIMI
ncbi:nesprin-3 [Grus japonensis]|uniref:Nesprin-3 n=1 Tax=Grus japonensis TaxID=30415 RepID=A0ABC9WZZ6_GRUJA